MVEIKAAEGCELVERFQNGDRAGIFGLRAVRLVGFGWSDEGFLKNELSGRFWEVVVGGRLNKGEDGSKTFLILHDRFEEISIPARNGWS